MTDTALSYPFADHPEPDERVRVRDGIDWIRLPLPFALDHVNCWLLSQGEERALVDTGIATSATRAIWRRQFDAEAATDADAGDDWSIPADRLPQQLLVTHFHPDHMGLAGWFAEQGVALLGHEVEVGLSNDIWHTPPDEYAQYYANWYSSNGVPAEAVDRVRAFGNAYRRIVHQTPEQWTFLAAGQEVTLGGRRFTVLEGRGHAPAMLMLFDPADALLIAADQVLPRISPNVSLMPLARDDNPLESFLATLDVLAELPADTLVLPSHGRPFVGLHARLDALRAHHQERLLVLRERCDTPQTAHELFSVLFNRDIDAQQMSFALGESLAHLRCLERRGELRAFDEQGLKRFARA